MSEIYLQAKEDLPLSGNELYKQKRCQMITFDQRAHLNSHTWHRKNECEHLYVCVLPCGCLWVTARDTSLTSRLWKEQDMHGLTPNAQTLPSSSSFISVCLTPHLLSCSPFHSTAQNTPHAMGANLKSNHDSFTFPCERLSSCGQGREG